MCLDEGQPHCPSLAQLPRGSSPGSPAPEPLEPAHCGGPASERQHCTTRHCTALHCTAAPAACSHARVFLSVWGPGRAVPGRDPAGCALHSAEFGNLGSTSPAQETLPKPAELSENVASPASPASRWGTARSPFL